MKFSSAKNQQLGGTLIVVLMVAGILAAALASYLALAASESRSTTRSLTWNGAMPLAETGVEEALSHLNVNTNNYAADGWTTNAAGLYVKNRTLGDSNYRTTISGSPGSVVTITSTGNKLFVNSNYISRTIQVTARTAAFRQVGLVARTISFGGNLGVDSYDSSNPTYSTAGAYVPAKASDKAIVATPGSVGFSIGGSSRIKGFAATGPGGSVSTGGSSSVGDASYGGSGIQTSPINHVTNNWNAPMRDVVAPFASGTAPAAGAVGGTNYTYVLNGGKYKASTFDNGGSSTTVYVSGSNVLYVTGSINISRITYAAGGKLDLYVGTSTINFSPTLVNGTPPQFVIWGLPTCTSMTMNSSTVFTGVIYAPQLNLTANGGASICGSIGANSFTCNGTFDFHYDLATTGSNGADKPVSVLTWLEL